MISGSENAWNRRKDADMDIAMREGTVTLSGTVRTAVLRPVRAWLATGLTMAALALPSPTGWAETREAATPRQSPVASPAPRASRTIRLVRGQADYQRRMQAARQAEALRREQARHAAAARQSQADRTSIEARRLADAQRQLVAQRQAAAHRRFEQARGVQLVPRVVPATTSRAASVPRA
jgi:hypothetical protein